MRATGYSEGGVTSKSSDAGNRGRPAAWASARKASDGLTSGHVKEHVPFSRALLGLTKECCKGCTAAVNQHQVLRYGALRGWSPMAEFLQGVACRITCAFVPCGPATRQPSTFCQYHMDQHVILAHPTSLLRAPQSYVLPIE